MGILNDNKYQQGFNDEVYILEPFPKDKLEPLEWTHILATLDVCTNEGVPTQFCEKESYNS